MKGSSAPTTIASAFGAVNRDRLINKYFVTSSAESVESHEAWAHVYRLLLWVDKTTGLGHCYESDKSQPGKHWYSRSLAFHDWVSDALSVAPADLARNVDWLFIKASEDLAAHILSRAAAIAAKAEEQLRPYRGRGFPRPGEDPELIAIVRDCLGDHLVTEPSSAVWDLLVERIRQYLTLENKRKNLVGEGFEDVLAQVIRRFCTQDEIVVHTRRALHELPGFNRPRAGDKPNKVDLAVLRPAMRTLVTVKWSVRADREKQFVTDFADYVAAESDRKPFEYVFVTNEFDPARLVRACDQLSANAFMFKNVVHINTDALRAAYAPDTTGSSKEATSVDRVISHIDSGRLISLEKWLMSLTEE